MHDQPSARELRGLPRADYARSHIHPDKLPPQSEKAFQRQIIDLARWLHWAHYHTWRSDRSPSGFPDLVLVRPPRILFVEVKREEGKVTPAQLHWLQVLGACRGVEVATWRPSDWALIEATLA